MCHEPLDAVCLPFPVVVFVMCVCGGGGGGGGWGGGGLGYRGSRQSITMAGILLGIGAVPGHLSGVNRDIELGRLSDTVAYCRHYGTCQMLALVFI